MKTAKSIALKVTPDAEIFDWDSQEDYEDQVDRAEKQISEFGQQEYRQGIYDAVTLVKTIAMNALDSPKSYNAIINEIRALAEEAK